MWTAQAFGYYYLEQKWVAGVYRAHCALAALFGSIQPPLCGADAPESLSHIREEGEHDERSLANLDVDSRLNLAPEAAGV
jgi:hypothetical protein